MLTSKNGSHGAAKDIEKLKKDIAQLAHQLGNVADSATETGLDQMRTQMLRVKSGLDSFVSEAGDRSLEAADAAREVAESFAQILEDTVRRRPIATLALALSAGFIAGTTWRR